MPLDFPPPRAKDCCSCTDPIALVQHVNPSDEKYQVLENRNDIICSKVCFHLFHEACIRQWIVQGRECPLCRNASFSRNIVHFDGFKAAYEAYLNGDINELRPPRNARAYHLSGARENPFKWIGVLVIACVAFYVIFKATTYVYRKLKKPEPTPQDIKTVEVSPSKGVNTRSLFLLKSSK